MGFPLTLCADMSGLIISSNSRNATLVNRICSEIAPRHISHNQRDMFPPISVVWYKIIQTC